MRDRLKILGFGVDSFVMEEAADFIVSNHGQIVTLNPEMINYAAKDKQFSDIISNSELVIPDGIGVEIGLKILGHKVKRIAGIDFGKLLIEKFYKNGKSIALVGAKPEVLDLAVKNLKDEYNGINIVYSHHGYFDDEDKIKNDLISSDPDLVLAALGSPKQEIFLFSLKDKLPNSVMIGLGGSFDVWAGVVERAPAFYRKLGLEWLYRTIKQPERFKRIFPTLPLFVFKVLKERLSN